MAVSIDRLSLRTQLVLLALAAVVLGSVGTVIFLFEEWREGVEEAETRSQLAAQQVADELDARMRTHLQMLEQIAKRPRILAMDAAACDPVLADVASLLPELLSLGLRRPDASLVCSSLANANAILKDEEVPFILAALARGQAYVGRARFSDVSRSWIAVVAVPVRDASGAVRGGVYGPIDLVRYSERVFERLPPGIVVSVHDNQHRILLRSQGAEALVGRTVKQEMDAVGKPDASHQHGVDIMGVPSLLRLAPMHHGNWMVIAGVISDEDTASMKRLITVTLAALLGSAFLALGVSSWLGRRIARPLDSLAEVAGKAAAGEATLRVPEGGTPEVRRVAAGLNRILDALAAAGVRHALLAQHMDTVVRHSGEVVMLVDEGLHVVDASEAALAAYGYTRDDMLGLSIDALRLPGATGPSPWESVFAGTGASVFEETHRRSDGSPVPVEVRTHAFDLQGRRHLQVFTRNVAEARAAHDRLRLLTFVLDQSPVGVLVTDAQGRIVYVNAAYARGKGYTVRELAGNNASLVRPGSASATGTAAVWDDGLQTLGWHGEVLRRCKDGSLRTCRVVVTHLRDPEGRDTGMELEAEEFEGQARVEALEAKCRELGDALEKAKGDTAADPA